MWHQIPKTARACTRKCTLVNRKEMINMRCLSTSNSSLSGKIEELYNSPVPTYHLQSKIPQLPLPRLEDTCSRYLQSLQATTNEEQFTASQKIVKEFQDSVGKELHAELVRQVTEDPKLNYVSRYWNDMYLKSRYPLLHNFNVAIGISDEIRPGYNHPVLRATNFTVALCNFMKALENQTLEPYGIKSKPNKMNKPLLRYLTNKSLDGSSELKTVTPICMSQFNNIFKGTRIPENERDQLQVYPNSKHIVVFRNGHIYAIDVLTNSGDIKDPSEIMADLKYVYDEQVPKAEQPIAVLTAGDRDAWKATRDKLIADGNEAVLNLIDSAIYVVALDEENYKDEDATAKGFLQGDGYNRWFDKPLTLIFTETGRTSLHMEHAWGDGMSLLYPINSAYAETLQKPVVGPDTEPANKDSSKDVKKLVFNISDEVAEDIKQTTEWFEKTKTTLNVQYFNFDKFGSTFIKSQKMSPDSFIQLGYQLAFYRLYGFTPSTYESCSTAIFKHGRTETMRPATMATRRVCEMVTSNKTTDSNEFREAVAACSKLHGKLTIEAAMGNGYDRHLFALRNLVAEQGRDMPGIFTDPSYAMMCNFVLSTSTVGETPAISLGAFAPVAVDGYGIGYGVYKEKIMGSITSYETRDCQGFVDCLNQSLEDMAALLQKS